MRLVVLIAAIVFTLCAVLLGGARQVGRSAADDTFPLPDAEGCWAGVCLFDLTYSDMADALDCRRDKTPGTACFPLYAASTGSSARLRLEFAPSRAGWAHPDDRTLYSIHRVPPNPLLRLGELLAALGPPESVNILPPYNVVLIYPARGLRVTVIPALRGEHGQAYVRPGDPIMALDVYNLRVPPPQDALYYPRYFPWTGLGVYGVE